MQCSAVQCSAVWFSAGVVCRFLEFLCPAAVPALASSPSRPPSCPSRPPSSPPHLLTQTYMGRKLELALPSLLPPHASPGAQLAERRELLEPCLVGLVFQEEPLALQPSLLCWDLLQAVIVVRPEGETHYR